MVGLNFEQKIRKYVVPPDLSNIGTIWIPQVQDNNALSRIPCFPYFSLLISLFEEMSRN